MTAIITSTANPLIKRIRGLERRKQRDAEGAFFVEGIRPVWLAVEAHREIENLIVSRGLLKSERASEMVEQQKRAGTPVAEVSSEVYASIAEREHPSGLGAIVRASLERLDDLLVTPASFWVALLDAGNPGNLGTIIRTVDGVGGSGVILVGHTTDPFHPASVKASMGTLFHVSIARANSLDTILEWSRSHRVQLVTTSARAPLVFWDAAYRTPLVLLFGGEGEGLSDAAWAEGDLAVRVPMMGAADSLNLAVSAGVLLYEVKRQQLVKDSGD